MSGCAFLVTENFRARDTGWQGGLIVEPSAFEHPDARGELFWGGRGVTQSWISPNTGTADLIMAQRELRHSSNGSRMSDETQRRCSPLLFDAFGGAAAIRTGCTNSTPAPYKIGETNGG